MAALAAAAAIQHGTDSLIGYGLAFILFRLFDITKPGPVRKAEALPGAAGVIADDVLAGIAAGVVIAAILMTGGLMMAQKLAETVLDLARTKNVMIATAESCTGGMVAAALTDIAGSSAVVDRGFVTYSNAAKADMLGVAMDIINQHGAVSEDVVRAMAAGAANSIDHDGGKLAVSISGIAGPGGGTPEKPVGLVWFGCASRTGNRLSITAEQMIFEGNREDVRAKATQHALAMLDKALSGI